jgi:urate oxidase
VIAHSAYGTSRVRLVTVARHTDRDDLQDLTIAVRCEGEFDRVHTDGDNSHVLPTDTMTNTVYALAAQHPVVEPEAFGIVVCRHFLAASPSATRCTVELVQHAWARVPDETRLHPHAFMAQGPEVRRAQVMATADDVAVEAGVADLVIMKTAGASCAGFLRDRYTTQREAHDRLLATSLTATWRYTRAVAGYNAVFGAVRQTLLSTFADHDGKSVQHTMHAMGQAVILSHAEVSSIHLVMPDHQHAPVDLTPFGLENRNEIFVATDEPHGLMEVTLIR